MMETLEEKRDRLLDLADEGMLCGHGVCILGRTIDAIHRQNNQVVEPPPVESRVPKLRWELEITW